MRKRKEHFIVKESLYELKILLLKSFSQKERSKIEMLFALKENFDIPYSELSQKINISIGSIINWINLYKKGGVDLLLKKELLKGDVEQKNVIIPFEQSNQTAIIPAAKKYNDDIQNDNKTNSDVEGLKKWIDDTYVRKDEFVNLINEIERKSLFQDETLSVLRRIIKILDV